MAHVLSVSTEMPICSILALFGATIKTTYVLKTILHTMCDKILEKKIKIWRINVDRNRSRKKFGLLCIEPKRKKEDLARSFSLNRLGLPEARENTLSYLTSVLWDKIYNFGCCIHISRFKTWHDSLDRPMLCTLLDAQFMLVPANLAYYKNMYLCCKARK